MGEYLSDDETALVYEGAVSVSSAGDAFDWNRAVVLYRADYALTDAGIPGARVEAGFYALTFRGADGRIVTGERMRSESDGMALLADTERAYLSDTGRDF